MSSKDSWYKTWFDSPYYHQLYKHRDVSEASRFVRNLVDELKPAPGTKILDMGCGKGRHCIQLHDMGYDVTGIDLSSANIKAAKKREQPGLKFHEHDMRHPLEGCEFGIILNLFTSFGYFSQKTENLKVLQSAAQMLPSGGLFVLDFLNAHKVIQELVPEETREAEGNIFDIHRAVVRGVIVKTITINEDPSLRFEERVQALEREELFELFDTAGLTPTAAYGSYDFTEYHPEQSDRLIIIAAKK